MIKKEQGNGLHDRGDTGIVILEARTYLPNDSKWRWNGGNVWEIIGSTGIKADLRRDCMWKRVWEFAEKNGMFGEGDRVILGVSGGADSVCLLTVMAENDRELRLRVVHVHHGLRGKEADRDAEFVGALCQKLGVPFEAVYRDAAGYAREQGLSVEEAGRILRYEALERAAQEWEEESRRIEGVGQRPVWIAVAHHQDDNVETILHHLLRGSGLRGLAGMQPVQGNRVRPLLGVRRQEIVEYLEERGIGWCEDSSNGEKAYTRNRIRGDLIPYMIRYVNERTPENILHAGGLIGQADRYLRGQAEKVWEDAGQRMNFGVSIGSRVFLGQEPIIRSYLIRLMLDITAPGHKNITAKHFEQIERLVQGPVGGRCDLPGSLQARRTYEELVIEICSGKEKGNRQELEDREEGRVFLPEVLKGPVRVGNMEFQAFSWKKGTEITKKEYTKWFDYDKIKDTLSVRYRQPGDYLTLPGGGHKTLKRFLIDEKAPREARDQILVLAEKNHVLWVVGYRISEYYKIAENTHTILQVDFYGGKAYGR